MHFLLLGWPDRHVGLSEMIYSTSFLGEAHGRHIEFNDKLSRNDKKEPSCIFYALYVIIK